MPTTSQKLLTVDDFYRLYPDGRSEQGERFELIEGVVYRRESRDRHHRGCVLRLSTALSAAVQGRALVMVSDLIEPEETSAISPDIALLPLQPDFYDGWGIEGTDTLLVVEVSRTSLYYDRGPRSRIYARTGVADLWIAEVDRRMLEVRRAPGPLGYASIQRLGPDDLVSPLAFPDLSFRVETLVGRARS
jgi:Uma2 family endonuclease